MGLPQAQRDRIRATDEQAIQGDRMLDYEVERTTADGRTRLMRAIKAPLHGADGQVNGIVSIAEDITDRRRVEGEKAEVERQLQQVQKMDTIGRLAGGVAHDFNNLLTPIMGYVDLALATLGKENPLTADLTVIREAASRAADLSRGLLTFSRSQVLKLRDVNLNTEIQAVHRMLARVIGEEIEIVLRLDPALESVQADTTQMHQVLMNLAVNARDAMPHGGKLVLESANIDLEPGYAERTLNLAAGPYVMLSVTDTGTGMSKETQARIFEPFFTTKEAGKGTGLGLSIVYGIVRQHGGTISVFSEPGQGTSFKLLLPRRALGNAQGAAVNRPIGELRGHDPVLVVEDDRIVREAVATLLESLGYHVLQAGTPRQARDQLLALNPDAYPTLLVADVVLPGESGVDLFLGLKQRHPDLRVLYMSGYPHEVLVEAGRAIPPDRIIGKPFGLCEFAQKVRDTLAQPPLSTSASARTAEGARKPPAGRRA